MIIFSSDFLKTSWEKIVDGNCQNFLLSFTCKRYKKSTACAKHLPCWMWSSPDRKLFRDIFCTSIQRRRRRLEVSTDRRTTSDGDSPSTFRQSTDCRASRGIRLPRIFGYDNPNCLKKVEKTKLFHVQITSNNIENQEQITV